MVLTALYRIPLTSSTVRTCAHTKTAHSSWTNIPGAARKCVLVRTNCRARAVVLIACSLFHAVTFFALRFPSRARTRNAQLRAICSAHHGSTLDPPCHCRQSRTNSTRIVEYSWLELFAPNRSIGDVPAHRVWSLETCLGTYRKISLTYESSVN